ncbi:ABC transporter permease [Paenibacillus septentrionalis]|uniref:ABC transporter permease n=1 Tax=Paenibacillus septentrionalis TaxID=429342 RepID=A0ABW1V7K5_9BACL
MNSLQILLVKELRESWRSFKLIWIPIVFILLGVSDPLMNYYMEDILQAVGNMPEGIEIVGLALQPLDVLMASTGQFQLTGVIVIIAVFIGSISRERSNGTATLIYIRPVSATAIVMSKWLVSTLVAGVSALLGYAGSMYYTSILYGGISLQAGATIIGTYFVWLLFVMAVTVALSAAFSTGVAATIAIILIPIGGMIDSLLGSYWHISPWKLVNYGVMLTANDQLNDYYWKTLSITIAITVVILALGIWSARVNRSLTKV